MPAASDDEDPMVIEDALSRSSLRSSHSESTASNHQDIQNLLGEKIIKYFKGHGWFEGEITHYDW